MPILRDGGGTPIEFQNPRPQTWISPDQSVVNVVDTTATQTLTNKTFTSPSLTAPTITNPTIVSITPVIVTTASTTLTVTQANRPIVLDRATGIVVTMPTATGTGNTYPLYIKTTATGATSIVQNIATDVFAGNAILHDTDDATLHGFSTTNATTITLYGASNATGGIRGGKIVLTDADTNLWVVEYQSNAAASPSTPFS